METGMRTLIRYCISGVVMATLLAACSQDAQQEISDNTVFVENPPVYPSQPLPEGLQWETNNEEPVYASADAKPGGTFRTFMLAFPLNLRSVGPDSNSSFRGYLDANQLSLTTLHPNTHKPIPQLATHWAYDKDGVTLYYKLDPSARWSDGKPVVADDYLFTLEFMRSKFIVAPWYNDYYTQEIKDVKKYDDYTISVTAATVKPKIDMHYYYSLPPMPRHFHKLDENWVTDYNWRVQPTTGPYAISKVKKGKFVEFSRVDNWWGRDHRYFKNLFNVDKVRIDVIRDVETAYRHFLKGDLDAFPMLLPEFWHDKGKGEPYDKGYIHKIWFYNDMPQPSSAMYLNEDAGILGDINIRYGLAHSMNVDKMLKTILRGDYERLHNMHTGYGAYTNTKIRAREFDLEKADFYFKKAGWSERGSDGIRVKDGKRLSFKVNYGAPHHTDRLVFLKEEAKKAGVELVLEQMDASASFKRVIEKQHEIAWMGFSTGFRPAYWEHFHSDNAHKPQTNNITNTDDPKMDELVMRYRNDTGDTSELAKIIQEKIHEIGSVIPTYMAPYAREAYWRWLKLPPVPGTRWSDQIFDPFGGLFWIDPEEKERTLAAKKAGEAFEPVTIIDTTYKVNYGGG
jgi:microcin C transport system substrate-binding protein